ncbi:hypothetical protein [Amycolatopsis sp.]|uniref:hypothetical protein n=1 Tax=Amycolatopsis sp. TaxID=37632 RepID=UPI00260D7D07|nr:hypothetical protein [Amycolatopsis sp.]
MAPRSACGPQAVAGSPACGEEDDGVVGFNGFDLHHYGCLGQDGSAILDRFFVLAGDLVSDRGEVRAV